MRERGQILAWTLVLLLLFLWLRFLVHVDPRFPGSLAGSALGIAAGALMLVPLAYSVAKRVFRVRGERLRSFLTVHIYAGLLAAVLAVLHTGHKFDNPLGVLLMSMTLVVVLSGFVGRYLLQHCSRQLGEKRRERSALEPAFDAARRGVIARATEGGRPVGFALVLGAVMPWPGRDRVLRLALREALRIVDAATALDTSIALHEQLQSWFRLWMRIHLVLTLALYLLLGTHVFIVVYYGLRWLPE